MQEATGDSVNFAYADQGYTGEHAVKAAADHGIALEVVKLPEAKHGFVHAIPFWCNLRMCKRAVNVRNNSPAMRP